MRMENRNYIILEIGSKDCMEEVMSEPMLR